MLERKMIKAIHIRNFKSLGDVKLRLAKFTCLIGMNGAGKSSVLQAVDFISQLMIGRVEEWLDARGWSAADLNCKVLKESNVTVGVHYETSTGKSLRWVGAFNRSLLHCTAELIEQDSQKVFRVGNQKYTVADKPSQDIAFTYQGSLLSALKDSELTPELLEFRNALQQIKSLELLSPQLLRKRARTTDKGIGTGGEKLSAFLDTLPQAAKAGLIDQLQRFYPNLVDFKVSSLKSGWKKLTVVEQFSQQKLETDAAHLNDGLLRILAVLTQAASDRSLILLDEIENGINQEVIETLVDTLVASPHQLLVTTHSPLILNYLEDDVARGAVQFIYKAPLGETRVRPFFKIPRINDKLRTMGPGDAFVDTDLKQLTQECLQQDLKDGIYTVDDL
jgi:predicted ATPase